MHQVHSWQFGYDCAAWWLYFRKVLILRYSPEIAKIRPDSPWNNTRLRHMAVSTQLGHRKNIWKWQVLVHKTWISCQNLCLFRTNLHKQKHQKHVPIPHDTLRCSGKGSIDPTLWNGGLGVAEFRKNPLKRMGPFGVYTYYKYSNINMKKHQCILYTY